MVEVDSSIHRSKVLIHLEDQLLLGLIAHISMYICSLKLFYLGRKEDGYSR
jgi:hypothetical protein